MCLCRILIGLLVACCWAATPLAQSAEFGAAQKRYRDLSAAGDYAGALDEAQKTAAAVKASVGEQHEQYAAALVSVANALRTLARYSEAEETARRAVAIAEQARGPSSGAVASAIVTLGLVHEHQGRYDEADRLYRRALAIRELIPEASPVLRARSLTHLAAVARKQGRLGEAQELGRRILAIYEKAKGGDDLGMAAALTNVGLTYEALGRYGDAATRLQGALTIYERIRGANHPEVATALNHLADVDRLQARFDEGEQLYRRALAIREQAFGDAHPFVAQSLNGLAILNRLRGRYRQAEELYARVLAMREKTLGADHPDVAQALNNLAVALTGQGRYREAETLYRRALAIYEQARGQSHADFALALNNLADVYRLQSRSPEAEALYRRALAIREQVFGPDHPLVAVSSNALALLCVAQRHYDEAEALYRRTLAIREKTLGAGHPDVGQTLSNLGVAYEFAGRHAEAEDTYRRALAIREQALGPDHPDVAQTLSNLARLYRVEKRDKEAEELYRRVLSIREKSLGASHPDVALTFDDLAALAAATSDREGALGLSRKATAAVLAHAAIDLPRAEEEERSGGLVQQRAAFFHHHVANLAAATPAPAGPAAAASAGAGRGSKELPADRGREAFEIAQWAMHSSSAAALQQVAARFAAGDTMLAALVREQQDLAAAWRADNNGLLASFARADAEPERQGADRRAPARSHADRKDAEHKDAERKEADRKGAGRKDVDRKGLDAARKRLSDIEARLAAVSARLEKEFPDYAALANPQALAVPETQKLLRADEALVFWLTGDQTTYVFALTGDGFLWRSIPLGAKDLGAKVAAFRRGLDVADLARAIEAGRSELFDLAFAHDLYVALMAPVEALVRDKKNLIVVPSGALTGLPFHLLVTDKPAVDAGDVHNFDVYRDAAWLMKRHAISVLPSVTSLKALRGFARGEQGAKPMIGFGDPTFTPAAAGTPAAAATAATATGRAEPAALLPPAGLPSPPAGPASPPDEAGGAKAVAATRGPPGEWHGSRVDRGTLEQALVPLPETAAELRAVAARLEPGSDIFLGRDASESVVKQARLADYRVVYFATHGLVAGDIQGLTEPSLALAFPREPSALDDGLLTASEIAELKLNTEWVVLSACNTAAGDKPGAEALSGLARAFFYAGASALLVSHWTVESGAAARLAIATFNALKSDPGIGRAEAVRRAMLDYLNDKADPRNAYPAYWAPFSVVGEGAGRSSD